MKKPLQTNEEQFLISSKGRLIGWGVADVKNLIRNANRAQTEDLRSKQHLSPTDAECVLTHEWLEVFLTNGVTDEVVKRLNSRIAHVRYHHFLMHSPNGPPFWRRVANGDQIDDPELAIAYGVAHLLAAGAFEGLKRCRLKTCQKFFVGRPDAKWCSKACGSKFRVKKKRKRDRAY
jgi:predicted RNA-binding Zn ribbon-like protein